MSLGVWQVRSKEICANSELLNYYQQRGSKDMHSFNMHGKCFRDADGQATKSPFRGSNHGVYFRIPNLREILSWGWAASCSPPTSCKNKKSTASKSRTSQVDSRASSPLPRTFRPTAEGTDQAAPALASQLPIICSQVSCRADVLSPVAFSTAEAERNQQVWLPRLSEMNWSSAAASVRSVDPTNWVLPT